jgi:YHS domain-containing protein
MRRGIGLALVALSFLGCPGCTLNDRLKDAVRDPVCGKTVVKESATITRVFLRKTYYFDSEDCAGIFELHPARYCDMSSALYPVYDY